MTFDMYLYRDKRSFSASVNTLNLKPSFSQYSRLLGYTRTKKGTGSKSSKTA